MVVLLSSLRGDVAICAEASSGPNARSYGCSLSGFLFSFTSSLKFLQFSRLIIITHRLKCFSHNKIFTN